MSSRVQRRLLSVRREVPRALELEYGVLWAQLAGRVQAAGSHAWRFVALRESRLHLEFLEFEAAQDPRDDGEAATILARLDAEIGPGTVEEWLEAG